MKPPSKFKIKKNHGWSKCFVCDKWRKCQSFHHEGSWLVLCVDCWEDYWDNTDELAKDYRPPLGG